MAIGSIASYGFQAYTTPLNSGPTTAQPVQQAQQADQAQEEQRETRTQQAQENEGPSQTGGGNVTATRGQNLNITV